jgi:hypothetical protein
MFQIEAVFCHSCLIGMMGIDMPVVLLNSYLKGKSNLSIAGWTPLVVNILHAWHLQSQVIYHYLSLSRKRMCPCLSLPVVNWMFV